MHKEESFKTFSFVPNTKMYQNTVSLIKEPIKKVKIG